MFLSSALLVSTHPSRGIFSNPIIEWFRQSEYTTFALPWIPWSEKYRGMCIDSFVYVFIIIQINLCENNNTCNCSHSMFQFSQCDMCHTHRKSKKWRFGPHVYVLPRVIQNFKLKKRKKKSSKPSPRPPPHLVTVCSHWCICSMTIAISSQRFH